MSVAGQDTSSDIPQGSTLSSRLQHTLAAALADLETLVKHPVYVLNVAATAVYTGAQPAKRSSIMCFFCKLRLVAYCSSVVRCLLLHFLSWAVRTDRHLTAPFIRLEASSICLCWHEQRAIRLATHCNEGVTALLCHCLDQAHQLMCGCRSIGSLARYNPASLLLLFAVDSCYALYIVLAITSAVLNCNRQ